MTKKYLEKGEEYFGFDRLSGKYITREDLVVITIKPMDKISEEKYKDKDE